jgi:Type ISP C-terminal specificity domain
MPQVVAPDQITLRGVPEEAYGHVLRSRSAIEWIMERYQVKVDKAGKIRNDPNEWSREVGNPRDIIDLPARIVAVSLKTMTVVDTLPKLEVLSHQQKEYLVTQIQFDKQDQLEKIQAGLMEGETLFAVYDGKGKGTGFIGLTDRRVIIQDNSFVGGKIALTSLPYKRRLSRTCPTSRCSVSSRPRPPWPSLSATVQVTKSSSGVRKRLVTPTT